MQLAGASNRAFDELDRFTQLFGAGQGILTGVAIFLTIGLILLCFFVALGSNPFFRAPNSDGEDLYIRAGAKAAVDENGQISNEPRLFSSAEVASAKRKIRGWVALLCIAVLVLAVLPMSFLYMDYPRIRTAVAQANATDALLDRQKTSATTMNDISFDGAKELAAGNAESGWGTVAVVDSSGKAHNLPVEVSPRGELIAQETLSGVAAKGSPLTVTRGEQYRYSVQGELLKIYGLSEDGAAWDALRIPDAEPSKFTAFGSTDVVQTNGSEYVKTNATLIWDGGYKLISSDGGSSARELNRI